MKKTKLKKQNKITKEKRFAIKLLLCSVYLIVITILSVCSYKIYNQKKNIMSSINPFFSRVSKKYLIQKKELLTPIFNI